MFEKIFNFIKERFNDYKTTRIIEYENKYYVFVVKNKKSNKVIPQGSPVFVFDNSQKIIDILDITSNEVADIWQKGKTIYLQEEQGETDMEKEKIRKLLEKYGAPQDAIEDFMNDLYETKDDIEEMGDMQKDEKQGQDEYNDFAEKNNLDENDNKLKEIAKDEEQHEDFLLNAQNVALLKATQEGKELLINAPTMAKDELEKAIKEYLLKNKGE